VKLKVTVDGKTYEVEVEVAEPDAPQPGYVPPAALSRSPMSAPAAPPRPSAAPVADDSKVCRSPIAGMVFRVAAQVSQSIQVGDILLVLEAMKMETVITSPIAGKVARVNVNVGDAVQVGQVLVEFE
jgi:methylmalonyl-CoA carboxyltransferase small subunit